MRQAVEKTVSQLLDDDIIEEARSSPWSSPVLLVPKNTVDWRMCVDYRLLNANTKSYAYPMPSMSAIFAQLKGQRYYAKFDWTSGFHQLLVDEASRDCTTFAVPRMGLYRFKRLPFGVKNGPPVFQERMERAFSVLLHSGLEIFVDDHVVT